MSRTSRRSELSPSVTRGGGSNIDLGKRDVVNMGGKPSPSLTSGKIGVTQEVTNIGGVSVTGGVSVEISPLNLGVNFDPSENSVSIAAGGETPGGLLGIGGSATIDLDTGEVTGGSIGGEALGLGVNISSSKDGGLGIELTLQIPFTPVELSLGLQFSSKKPRRSPSIPPAPKGIGYKPNELPPLNPNCIYHFHILILNWRETMRNLTSFGWQEGQVEKGVGSAHITGLKLVNPNNPRNGNTITVAGDGGELRTVQPNGGPSVDGFQKYNLPTELITESIMIIGFVGYSAALATFAADMVRYTNPEGPGWTYQIYPEVLSCPAGESSPDLSRSLFFDNPPPIPKPTTKETKHGRML